MTSAISATRAEVRDYSTVTELSGDDVTRQQITSAYHRYTWAAEHCAGKDVLEVACGSGVGLGLLARVARSTRAGDITPALVARAQAHYGDRIAICLMDAEALPFPDATLDVVILCEALYYLPHPERFVAECRRVLRPGGAVLITNSNKDMPDFAPSPFANVYHGVVELEQLFAAECFGTSFFGYWTYETARPWVRALVPIKRAVVASGLMPRTMQGKKLLKRVVFGRLEPMPRELQPDSYAFEPPAPLAAGIVDRCHRVVYCVARCA